MLKDADCTHSRDLDLDFGFLQKSACLQSLLLPSCRRNGFPLLKSEAEILMHLDRGSCGGTTETLLDGTATGAMNKFRSLTNTCLEHP